MKKIGSQKLFLGFNWQKRIYYFLKSRLSFKYDENWPGSIMGNSWGVLI